MVDVSDLALERLFSPIVQNHYFVARAGGIGVSSRVPVE
jgi:hypothetical protein